MGRNPDPDILHCFYPGNNSSTLVGGRGILVFLARRRPLVDRVRWFAATSHHLRLWPRGDARRLGLANGRTRQ